MIQDSVYQFSTNSNIVIAQEWEAYLQQATDLARYCEDRAKLRTDNSSKQQRAEAHKEEGALAPIGTLRLRSRGRGGRRALTQSSNGAVCF